MADKITYEVWWCDHCGMDYVKSPIRTQYKLSAFKTIHEAIDWITKNIKFPMDGTSYSFKGNTNCAAIYMATNDKISSDKCIHARGRMTIWPPQLKAKTAQ